MDPLYPFIRAPPVFTANQILGFPPAIYTASRRPIALQDAGGGYPSPAWVPGCLDPPYPFVTAPPVSTAKQRSGFPPAIYTASRCPIALQDAGGGNPSPAWVPGCPVVFDHLPPFIQATPAFTAYQISRPPPAFYTVASKSIAGQYAGGGNPSPAVVGFFATNLPTEAQISMKNVESAADYSAWQQHQVDVLSPPGSGSMAIQLPKNIPNSGPTGLSKRLPSHLQLSSSTSLVSTIDADAQKGTELPLELSGGPLSFNSQLLFLGNISSSLDSSARELDSSH